MFDIALQRQLLSALAEGDSARVRELVSAGADVNWPVAGPGGETPLIRAIASGSLELVQLLVSLGADVNLAARGPRAWTPLMFAHAQPGMIRALIAAGAGVNARSGSDPGGPSAHPLRIQRGGETALHLAAAVANAEAVKALRAAGADVEARADNGLAPLDYAIRLGSMNEAALALVEAGAKLTPKRLEAMHAAAHSPDSDVVEFPILGPGMAPEDAATADAEASGVAVESTAEPRCPSCHALLYSRKPKVCGSCGALLPPELTLTDEEARARGHERDWAQRLADKFGPPDPTRRGAANDPLRHESTGVTCAENESPEELLRRISCASEFKARPRPAFWLYVIGYGIPVFVVAFLTFYVPLFPPAILLVAIGVFFIFCCFAWVKASPICPNCRQNIRLCPASYCHVCGQSLRSGRCKTCGVDDTWTSFFQPYLTGNLRWITYCPGCGVLLESRVRRWLARD